MSKEVDFPIANLYKNILSGCFLFTLLGLGLTEIFYSSASPLLYWISLVSYCLTFFVGIASFFFIRRNKLESRLPNYLAFVVSTCFLLFVFFSINCFFLALVSPPVPLFLAGVLAPLCLTYLVLSFKRSFNIIENCPAVISLAQNGFVETNGRLIIKKNALNKVDDTIKKYPFKFIEVVATALPLVVLAGLAMVGGVYKLTPNPDLTVRFFLAGIAFLISPPLIFMMVYGVYINYILPKRIYGERWKQIWREIE